MTLSFRAQLDPTLALMNTPAGLVPAPEVYFTVTPLAGGAPVAVYGAASSTTALAPSAVRSDLEGNASGFFVDLPGPYTLTFAGGFTVDVFANQDPRDVATPADVDTARTAAIAAAATDASAKVATEVTNRNAAITTAINALVAGAPGALDTLLELANQLATDESLATALTALVGTKAPLASPALTGTPTVGGVAVETTTGAQAKATAAQSAAIAAAATDATAKVAAEVTARNTAITTAINNLINGAPGALDTLLELANQLTADEGAAATLTTLVGTKAPLASPALTGTPTAPTAAALTSTTQLATTAFTTLAIAAAKTLADQSYDALVPTARGAWAAATAYALGDRITYLGVSYKTVTAHTSGAAFDGTKFQQLGATKAMPLDAILRGVPRDIDAVYTLSSLAVTATCSLNGAATAISGGVLRAPKLVPGSNTVCDIANDEAFSYRSVPSMVYGTVYPDYFFARTPQLTGGGAQAAFWYGRAVTVTDGRYIEVPFKCLVAATYRFRLKINGRYVTVTAGSGTTITGGGEGQHTVSQNSAGNLGAGNLYNLLFDLGAGSAGVEKVVEYEFQDQTWGGFYVEPTATLIRAGKPRFTLATLGDSLTGGAASPRSNNYTVRLADLLGADSYVNLGIGGSGFRSSVIGTDDFITRIPDVVAAAPDILFIWGGQNDMGSTAGQVQTAAQAVIAAVQAQLPNTRIFLVGMWSPGNPSATRVTLNNALRAAAVAQGVYFIDMIDPAGNGQTAPAWATGTAYSNGTVVTNGTVPYVCIVGHTAAGSFDATKFQATSWVNGTGRVGATTGKGNADVMINSADAIHQTELCNDLLERKFAAEAIRLMRADLTAALAAAS